MKVHKTCALIFEIHYIILPKQFICHIKEVLKMANNFLKKKTGEFKWDTKSKKE